MILALSLIGGLAEAAAWSLVTRRRVAVWRSLAVVLAAMGAAALATGRVALSPRVAPAVAVGVGLGAGAALFAATRLFVAVVAPLWPAFRRHVAAIYGQQGTWSVGATLVAALVVEVGEELFWRGLIQGRLAGSHGRLAGATLAWLAYVGANVPSLNLPIVAGAVVGGAVWGVLALWTGGVLACIACHAVWTELMIAFPPARAREGRGRRSAPAT
jgi:membrane protease YdiL (CAAX protease family)